MSAESAGVDEGTKKTMRELVSMVNDLESRLDQQDEIIEDQAERIEELEQQVEENHRETQINSTRINGIDNNTDRLSVGVGELQYRQLKKGATISKDGIDRGLVEDDLGLELEEVYDGQAMKAADVTEEDSEIGGKMVQSDGFQAEVEYKRQMLRRGFIEPEDLGGRSWKKMYRAIEVWDHFEKSCNEISDEVWELPSSKVRRILKDVCEDISESSLPVITGRVMETLADKSGGVLEVQTRETNEKILTGHPEDIKGAKKPLHKSTEVGDNTVVTPE